MTIEPTLQIGCMGVRPANLESIAAGLKLPPRSLQRRLAEEGVSIRELTQRHRMQMAAALLSEGGMSVEAIAASLGYADGTAFWRAHKKNGWASRRAGL
jgi:AraC-like DNA-binding protein